jgi:hypothetical protein
MADSPVIGERATPLDNEGTRPAYYGGAENVYEAIKIFEAVATPNEFYGWLRLTILKYQLRPAKGSAVLDAQKCAWYSRYLSEWLKRTGYLPAQKSEAVD